MLSNGGCEVMTPGSDKATFKYEIGCPTDISTIKPRRIGLSVKLNTRYATAKAAIQKHKNANEKKQSALEMYYSQDPV
jgi:hypothetical protein